MFSNRDVALGDGGADPPDRNPKKFIPTIDCSPDEENEGDEDDDDDTTRLRWCDHPKYGCGKKTYLRKHACANPSCGMFYMRHRNATWTKQKGKKVVCYFRVVIFIYLGSWSLLSPILF